jgi:hypothetical protein
MSTMPLQTGTQLAASSLAPLLKTTAREGRTGFFTIRTAEALRTISMLDGQVVFAGSNDREERLNSILVRRGMVGLADMSRAVEVMLRDGSRLGEVLIAQGDMDAAGVAKALRVQITEIVCRLLTLRSAEIGFREQAVADHSEVGFRTEINALIRASFFQVRDVHHVLDEVGGPNAVVAPTATFAAELASTGLRPEQQELVPLLTEPREVLAICAACDLPDFDVIRMIWVLLTVGALSRLA